MNNDRELLELAARAARIDVIFPGDKKYAPVLRSSLTTTWNPLLDDGDALRLAVKLCLFPRLKVMGMYIGFDDIDLSEEFNPNPNAATRRVIVRAAAEIGKSMP